jgi:hypothetical protein
MVIYLESAADVLRELRDDETRRFVSWCGEPGTGRVTTWGVVADDAAILAAHREAFASCTCTAAEWRTADAYYAALEARRT